MSRPFSAEMPGCQNKERGGSGLRIHLQERRPETADVISFIFDLGGQPFAYRPGQYVSYQLDALAFPDPRGPNRHFTISSSPTEKGIVRFTTRMRGSGFKETLRNAPLGYELSIGVPAGRFVMPEESQTRHHVFMAGGIGVTPFRSILRHAADTKKPVHALIFCFNHSSADIVFRQELEEIVRQMPNLSVVHVLSEPEPGWRGEQGKLDEALLRKYVPNPEQPLYWISGPPLMVQAYKDLLLKVGVTDKSVRTDSFTGY
jgi:ferredoxin-NADP reductase